MSFEPYFDDQSGLLCTWDGTTWDGGDSCQKTGLYRFGRWLKFKNDKDQLVREKAKFAQECDMLESPERKGWYIRSPSLGHKWWNSPYAFSRDQHRSLVIAMGALGQQKRLWKILWEHIKRGTLHQNNRKTDDLTAWKMPDVSSPDNLAELVRALYMSGAKWLVVLWPFMLLSDLSALIGLLLSFPHWRDPDEADDDNMIMSYLQAKYAMPTPISYIVRKLYKKYRPLAGAFRKINNAGFNGPQTAIAHKHRIETGAPPFLALYAEILKKEL